jgi:hypothetical protein
MEGENNEGQFQKTKKKTKKTQKTRLHHGQYNQAKTGFIVGQFFTHTTCNWGSAPNIHNDCTCTKASQFVCTFKLYTQ